MIDFIKMKLNISFPDTVRNLLKWTVHANFVPSMRNTLPQKLLLVLWVKRRRDVWTETVVGTTNKASSWNTLSWPTAECVSCWVRFVLVTDLWELERNYKSVWGRIVDEHFWPERYCALWLLGPKRALIILKLLSLNKEDAVRNPLNKEGKKPGTRATWFCIILFHYPATWMPTFLFINNHQEK